MEKLFFSFYQDKYIRSMFLSSFLDWHISVAHTPSWHKQLSLQRMCTSCKDSFLKSTSNLRCNLQNHRQVKAHYILEENIFNNIVRCNLQYHYLVRTHFILEREHIFLQQNLSNLSLKYKRYCHLQDICSNPHYVDSLERKRQYIESNAKLP